jgi:hypothetical protein
MPVSTSYGSGTRTWILRDSIVGAAGSLATALHASNRAAFVVAVVVEQRAVASRRTRRCMKKQKKREKRKQRAGVVSSDPKSGVQG